MAVFYQTYRPLKFADVIGQSAIVRVLVNASKNGQLAHAYLFTGSRGVGKTTLARIVAKSANCTKLKSGEPCGKCEICKAIANGSFLDVIEIDAASHTGVDNVRELIEHTQFKPTRGSMKVFIIDEVHMLSKAAFNALLKTLEEPPEHAMFILATTDIEKVPETIISRTQRLDFRKISSVDIIQHLNSVIKQEQLTLPQGAIELIAENAEGGMRDALSLLGVATSLGPEATIDEVRTLLGITPLQVIRRLISLIGDRNTTTLPSYFAEQAQLGTDFFVLNRNLLECLRELLVDHISNPNQEFKDDLSSKFTLPQLLTVIRLFLRSYKEIGQAPSADLPVLLAAIEAANSLGLSQATSRPATSQAPELKPSVVGMSDDAKSFNRPVAEQPSGHNNTSQNKQVVNEPVDDVTIEEFNVWWPDVISGIRSFNGPLATLLKNSPVSDVSNGIIKVAVKYLFHKENLESVKNNEIIRTQILALTGKKLVLKAVILKTDSNSESDSVAALGDALQMFGGELVE